MSNLEQKHNSLIKALEILCDEMSQEHKEAIEEIKDLRITGDQNTFMAGECLGIIDTNRNYFEFLKKIIKAHK